MSRGGTSEQVCVLREAIARIEGDGSVATMFGDGAANAVKRVSLGSGLALNQGLPVQRDLALDQVLGGGLRRGSLSEVVAGSPRDAGAASGFALAVAARFAAEMPTAGGAGPIIWVLEDGARAETGVPYAPGLAAHGLNPARLIVVRTTNGAESLWAMEEALKCRAVAAVVLDLWRTKTYDLVASRRLVLAAGASGTPGILVTAGAPGTARTMCSAAQTRFEVAAAPGAHVRIDTNVPSGMRLPLPGRAAWSVRLARIRAGPAGASGGFDWEKFWPLIWDHEEARFCDALFVSPPSLPRDRPHSAARGAQQNGWRAA